MSDRGDRKYNNIWHCLWKPSFKLDEYSVMFLYGCTLLGLTILYCLILNPSLTPEPYTEMEAEDTLNKILHFQPKNWRDRQTLKRQLNSLEIDSETEDYFYRILFHSQPVQTELSSASESRNFPAIAAIAHPQYDNLKIYIGLIRTIQKSTIAELRTRSQICRSQSALSRLKLQRSIDFSFPNFVDAHQIDTALSCPVNFEDLGGWSE